MKEEKTIEIVAPEGYEVDKERSSFEKIVFRALPEKGLPKTWEELGEIDGYYVNSNSCVNNLPFAPFPTRQRTRNTWPTREEAEASIALAQLCQLRDRYNGGWKPDWSSFSEKHCIRIHENIPSMDVCFHWGHVLVFPTKELRDEFMKNFADLIEKAKPLLG